jgi:hypothetical protein
MSLQKLVASFSSNCWIPCSKSLVAFLKPLDKKISNFQLYFNAKKYNSTNKVTFSDKERYDALVCSLVEAVKSESSFGAFTVNFDNWLLELESCLKQEQVYTLLSGNFSKGSYGKMIDDLNRILNPKSTEDDDDETIDPTENLKKYVKNYSQDFDTILQSCVDSGCHLYKSVIATSGDDLTPLCNQMLEQENPIFSIYSTDGPDKILALWVSEVPLTYDSITFAEYIDCLTNPTHSFNLNPEHQTNMDTIKRNYVNKQTELFKSHVKMLTRGGSLYFYKGKYLHSKDYDTYSELQFSNLVNSFPVSFEDYTKNAFALFYFKKGEHVDVNTFWITSKPIAQVMSDYDCGLFEWSDSNCEEFMSASTEHMDDSCSMLH